MQVIKFRLTMQAISEFLAFQGKSIGFVPTMGALHKGHLSLVCRARKENDFCIVSIFVNPTQFNDKKDLKKYSRNLKKDLNLLKKEKVDFVFVPTEKEMYSNGLIAKVKAPKIANALEGKFRKGHFSGVCTIVKKLFELIPVSKAYFGQKDFQQYLVIKKMVSEFKMPIEIIICPIVREKNGLALSSRNERLSKSERKAALCLSKSLKLAKKTIKEGEKDCNKIKNEMKKLISKEKLAKIEYVEICDKKTLKHSKKIDENSIALIAVWIGKIRLIDNFLL